MRILGAFALLLAVSLASPQKAQASDFGVSFNVGVPTYGYGYYGGYRPYRYYPRYYSHPRYYYSYPGHYYHHPRYYRRHYYYRPGFSFGFGTWPYR